MRIVFIGPPGAGKGTQAAKMIEKYRVAHLSTGDMLRAARDAKTEVGVKADKYMSAGELVPDQIIIDIIGERLAAPDCERLPVGRLPADDRPGRGARRHVGEKGTPLSVVLELRVPEEELFKRLSGAAGPTTRRT